MSGPKIAPAVVGEGFAGGDFRRWQRISRMSLTLDNVTTQVVSFPAIESLWLQPSMKKRVAACIWDSWTIDNFGKRITKMTRTL